MADLPFHGARAGLKVFFPSGWLRLQAVWPFFSLLACSSTVRTPVSVPPDCSWRLLVDHKTGYRAGFFVPNSSICPLLKRRRTPGRAAIKDFQPMQPGDVVATAADTQALEDWVGFRPSTPIETGVERFARWYREFYAV